ncbi:T9SS type A sorting domain-containing protein [Labilibacter sediminis]|nr:T9SS type A sorting domain-containing protein [Labilibacter sediminis]
MKPLKSIYTVAFMLLMYSSVFAQTKPNVLFVFADQFRNHALNGEDPTLTPNLDQFATEGVMFSNAISSNPVCTPFRGMLITGKNALTTGVTRNCSDLTRGLYLRPDASAFGNVFKTNGYQTGYIGKWHLDDATDAVDILGYSPDGNRRWDTYTPPGEKRQGFEFWHAYNAYDSHEAPHYWEDNTTMIEPGKWSPEHETDVAINYIENRDPAKPFILMMSYNPPHPPIGQVPQKYLDLYAGKTPEELLNRANLKLTGDGAKATNQVIDYFAAVSGIDDQFGRLITYLKENNLFDNTIVVFTADHGEMMGSQGRMYKNKWYEEAINIPLIVSYPNKMVTGVSQCIVSPVDFLPTLLNLAELETIPQDYDGKNLAASFKNTGLIEQDTVFIGAYQGDPYSSTDDTWKKGGWRGIRTLDHTFVITRFSGSQNCYLYDNENDQYQQSPIAATTPDGNAAFEPFYGSLKHTLNKMNDTYLIEDPVDDIESLLINPGFEKGNLIDWNSWGNGITSNADEVYEGKYAAYVKGNTSGSVQQAVSLKSNTDYVLNVWARVSAEGESANLIVKDFGGTKITKVVNTTEYTNYVINFTTGTIVDPVTISLYKANANYGPVFCDNFQLLELILEVQDIQIESETNCSVVTIGKPLQLQAKVSPSTALDKSVSWSVINGTGSVSVDANGLVSGLTEGTSQLVATANDGTGVSASFTVHVVNGDLPLNSIEIIHDNGGNEVPRGTSIQLATLFNPDYYCDQTVTWSVENITGEAFVTANGQFVAQEEGEVRVTATSKVNSEVTASMLFNVVEGIYSKYYVDNTLGDDNNNGLSQETSWKSLDKVNAYSFIPGDSIFFKAGDSWDGQLEVNCSGIDGVPVVFTRYGEGDKPQINGKGDELYTLRLLNSSYTEVSDLAITNQGASEEPGRRGVYMHANNAGDIHECVIKNLDIFDVNGSLDKSAGGGGAIHFNGDGETNSRFVDALIQGCHIYDCGRNGITSSTAYGFDYYHKRMVIRQNLIERIPGDGIVPNGCDSALVEYNICRDFTDNLPNIAGNAAAGIWPFNSSNTVIQHNEVSGHMASWDGQGFDADWNCTNTLIQYNYSHDNAGGFILICCNGKWLEPGASANTNAVVRYNISVNDGYRTWGTGADFCPSIHLAGPTKNTWVYNNTIYIEPKPASVEKAFIEATSWNGWSDETYFYNNIFYATEQTKFIMGNSLNNSFSHNLYSGPVTLPDDLNAVVGDARFRNPGQSTDVNDYILREGSPALNAGLLIPDNGGFDFFGNEVPLDSPSNIGAFNGDVHTSIFDNKSHKDDDLFFISPRNMKDSVLKLIVKQPLDNVNIRIVSLVGQVVDERSYSHIGSDEASFDVGDYRQGVYLVVLSSGTKDQTLKFIKR